MSDVLADATALTRIESSSYDPEGLAACREAVLDLWRERVGEPDEHDARPHVDVLTYAGEGSGRVAIVGHYDTVWPRGTLAEWTGPAEIDGRDVVTGPGIFDMKFGLAQAVWAVRNLRASGRPAPTVVVVLNDDEEVGSGGSRATIEETARTVDAALVLESTGPDGAIKSGRKGTAVVTLTATGREAHAGLEPEKGASAIHALAEVITRAASLAAPDRGTTINVGLVSGGTAANTVAGRAEALVDVRISEPAERQRLERELPALAGELGGATVDVDVAWGPPPMVLTDATRPLLDVVQAAAARLGRPLKHVSVGGASDANEISALGVPVLCGLGAEGDGAHARHEHVDPATARFRVDLLSEVLSDLADGLPAHP